MADNYVVKKKYAGLKADGDGQVSLKTEEVDDEDLIAAEADAKAARKNGGGAEKKSTTKE